MNGVVRVVPGVLATVSLALVVVAFIITILWQMNNLWFVVGVATAVTAIAYGLQAARRSGKYSRLLAALWFGSALIGFANGIFF